MRAIAALVLLPLLSAPAMAQGFRDAPFAQQTGEALYKNICQGCHMPDAKGAVGAGLYPALAANPRLAEAGYPILIVLRGQKAMPWFGDDLSDTQVANVVNYIRSHFGNHFAGNVKPQDVKAMR